MRDQAHPVENDRTYYDATSVTFGKAIGEFFQGLIEKGLTRSEALEVTKTYAYGLAIKPNDKDAEA